MPLQHILPLKENRLCKDCPAVSRNVQKLRVGILRADVIRIQYLRKQVNEQQTLFELYVVTK